MTIAFIATLGGATAIMASPITPWTQTMAFGGLVLVVAGVAVLIAWLVGRS